MILNTDREDPLKKEISGVPEVGRVTANPTPLVIQKTLHSSHRPVSTVTKPHMRDVKEGQ
jgi:hypothetical protein